MTAEGTSTLRETVARVIAEHRPHKPLSGRYVRCECGQMFHFIEQHDAHVADVILSVFRAHLESRAEELVEAAASALHTELIHPHSAPWGDNYWSSTLDANSCHKVAGRALSAFSRALFGVPTQDTR